MKARANKVTRSAEKIRLDKGFLNLVPDLQINEQNTPTFAKICARLDSIPLALELAAARLSLLTPKQIASCLDDAFQLLSRGTRTA